MKRGSVRDGGRRLIVFGGADPTAPLEWLHLEGANARVLARGVGGSMPKCAASQTVLILQGSQASVRRVTLPARTLAQARAGVGYVFDGTLAEPDSMHFAVGESQNESGLRLAAAMAPAVLQQWIDACAAAGASPNQIYLDFTLIDPGDDVLRLVQRGGCVLVCGGPLGGFAAEAALAGAVLGPWVAKMGLGAGTRVGVDPQVEVLARSPAMAGAVVTVRRENDIDLALAQASLAAPPYAPQVRQGDFSLSGPKKPAWRMWSLAAALALLAVLIQASLSAFYGYRDQQTAMALRTQAEAAFLAARPEIKRIVNFPAQVRSVANAERQGGAHPVLKATAPLLDALKTQPLVRLDALRHEGVDRKVHLRFSAETSTALQGMTAWMQTQGLKFEAKDVAPEAGRYVMTVELESPA